MRRMNRLALSSLALAATVAGFAHADEIRAEAPARDVLAIELNATTHNAGKIAHAFLSPDGEITRVVLMLSGVPQYVGRPIHVYTYIYPGTCRNLPPKPVWSLNERVLANAVTGTPGAGNKTMLTLAHNIPMPLHALRVERYAIGLRTAPADGDWLIFCGDISGG